MSTARVLTFLSLIFVVSCTSTGGTIGGLAPAPKITKGQLKDGVYTAMDRSFSVASPFQPGSNEYTYMEIDEQYAQDEAHIVFLSSVVPAEVYRVDVLCNVAKRDGPKTPAELGSIVRGIYSGKFVGQYGTPLVPESGGESDPDELHFTQVIPERNAGFPTYQKLVGFTVRHSSYSLEGADCVGNIWVNYPIETDAPAQPGIASPDAPGRMQKFVGSFSFTAPKHK